MATRSFSDRGMPSTADLETVAPVALQLLRSIEREAGCAFDVVVAEMGDGVIGRHGVETILTDPEFHGLIRAHVYCANDLVGAWGGVEWLSARDLALDVVAGPVTGNQVGTRYTRDVLHVEAANTRGEPERFGDVVEAAAFARKPA